MPLALRAKVAVVALFAILLIPIYTSSLRGLTHILTCDEVTDAAFTIQVDAEGEPTLSSSLAIVRDADRRLCGGLLADFTVGSHRRGRVDITMTITNTSEFGWQGSIELVFDGTHIPVGIGEIEAGEAASETVEGRIHDEHDYEIEGNLLVGP